MAIQDIRNFVLVTDNLATAGQPSEQQVADVAEAGFEVVVNLGLLDPRYCLADEAGLTKSLGMAYHHVPVNFGAPQPEDLEAFFAVMDRARSKKVFVHCAANYRVSSFIALYGQARLGWSADQADTHVRRIWEPNDTWKEFIDAARANLADAGSLKREGRVMSETQSVEPRTAFKGATPILPVRQLEASIDFYVTVLGFVVDFVGPGRFAAVSRDACHLFLSEGDQGNPGAWVWIGVDDVETLIGEYRARGQDVRHPPTNYPWAYRMQLEDPDGNVLRIGSEPRADRPDGTSWRDMRGTRWEQSPAGEWLRAADRADS